MALCPTNQPTAQPPLDIPKKYLSGRVTIARDDFHMFEQSVLYDVPQFIAYHHKGEKEGKTNSHFHFVFPCDDINVVEKIRKRAKKAFGSAGNKFIACSLRSNSILNACQYFKHEESLPIIRGEDAAKWWAESPEWVSQPVKSDKIDDHFKSDKKKNDDKSITYSNVVFLAVQKARAMRDSTVTFKQALSALMSEDRYTLTYQLAVHGLPEFYHHEYEARLHKRARPMSWMEFRP